MTKEENFRTARATIGCAHFKAGQVVSVRFDGKHGGTNWFMIDHSENGIVEPPVAYPEHHLTDFCL